MDFSANDTIDMGELWWVMVLEAGNPTEARMTERFYLSEAGPQGCRRVLDDVQKSAIIPMLAVNLEQIDGILDRFDTLRLEADSVIDIGEDKKEAWLVWIDEGSGQVHEQWTWTADPQEAERAAMARYRGASPLLRASLSTLIQARKTLHMVRSGSWDPIWLDLRDPPKQLSAAQLLELKIKSAEHA